MTPATRRTFLTLAGATALSACGPRGQFGVARPSPAVAGTQTLLIATMREADPAPIAYGPGRSPRLGLARLTISIPPTHKVGQIEWPRGSQADPTTDFALTGAEVLPDIPALLRDADAIARQSRHEAVLFVHGYNNTFAEGAYRQAQIAWDYGLRGPQIHFAWPSAGKPLGYTYDRDSVLFARDGLVRLLTALLGDRRLRLTLIGHSMGALLVMEALRQIAISGHRRTLDALEATTLISPDIDIDLFRAQAAALDPLPQPFTVALSQKDRLLHLSSSLSGGRPRLGSISDLAALKGLGIYVIDLTALDDGGSNHFLPGTSPAAIALMRGLRSATLAAPPTIAVGPVAITLGSDMLSGPVGDVLGTP